MTQPVPSTNAQVLNTKGGFTTVWLRFFQQFVTAPPAVADVSVGASPFSITANDNGTMVVSGGTVSLIQLIRGSTTITIATSTAIPRLVPISIGDTLKVTYTVLPTIQFVPS